MTIDIRQITSSKLHNGEYVNELPELYSLKAYTENGSWHLQQSVFDHIVKVYKSLEDLLSPEHSFLKTNPYFTVIQNYLDNSIGNQTRRNILFLTALLHDNAKNDTLIQNPDGSASCPGHELIGSIRAWKYQNRFGFDVKSMECIERLIRFHGLISEMLNSSLATGSPNRYFSLLTDTAKELTGELIFFMYADLLGGDLSTSDEKACNERLGVLEIFLNSYFSTIEK